MKTSLLSALLLLGFASAGMAWDWDLDDIYNFKTIIPGAYFPGCLGQAKTDAFMVALAPCYMLSPIPDLDLNWLPTTCDKKRKFKELMQHELCVADVCRSTNSDASLNETRIDWIFDQPIIADEREAMKEAIRDCADEAANFMSDYFEDNFEESMEDGDLTCSPNIEPIEPVETNIKRVLVSQCVKRTFVNTCGDKLGY